VLTIGQQLMPRAAVLPVRASSLGAHALGVGLLTPRAARPRRQAPMCQLFAVDMAFCGGEGLITDRASALVVMACSPVRRLPRALAPGGAGRRLRGPQWRRICWGLPLLCRG